jgi:tryptophan 2,3-dioxygenase
MSESEIIELIKNKYTNLGANPELFLQGLLHSKPLNYWDYVEVDTLLSLQKPKTDFKDEEIFIMYHQVTELTLKMMLHEIKQLAEVETFEESNWLNRLNRLIRYTTMLITSFDIMKDGMNYDDYSIFRTSLAPASGFQSAQFRYIEIYCTRLSNLINEKGHSRIGTNPNTEEFFEQIYWRDAGMNRETGNRSLTLTQFEERYLNSFIELANNQKGNTLEEIIMRVENPSEELKNKLREFDHLYNVEWPMVHLNTAKTYLDSKGENKEATGGSEWKKYLHPAFQQRKFFPAVWTDQEISNWAK